MTQGKLAILRLPIRAFGNFFNAFFQPRTAHPQAIHSYGIFRYQLFQTELKGIDIQLSCNLFQLHLNGESWLGSSVPPLGSTGRFVGKHTNTLKLVSRKLIRDCLQSTRVINRCESIAAVPAAIEKGSEVHGLQGAVLLHPGANPHLHWMSTPVDIKRLLPGQGIFYRPTGHHGELGSANFVRERIALPAKSSSHRRGNHSYVTHGKAQNL